MSQSDQGLGNPDHGSPALIRLLTASGSAVPDLRAILNSVADGITVQEPTGRLVYANAAAARVLGYSSGRDLLDAPITTVLERFEVFDEAGRPLPFEQFPGRRALQSRQETAATLRFRVVATAQERWAIVKATPLIAGNGTASLVVNVFVDITAAKRAEETQRFLAEAARRLESSLDYQATLQEVADLAVPTLADWCAVDVQGEDGSIRTVAVAHRDPAKVAWAREWQRRYPPDPNAPHGVPSVLRTGQPAQYPEISQELLAESGLDLEQRQLLVEAGFLSVLIVPLNARGQTLGALSLVWSESSRRSGPEELAVAEQLATAAGLAIDNARLYRESEAARAQAEAERQHLYDLFAEAPAAIAVLRGPDHRFEFANDRYLAFVGRSAPADLIGTPARLALPELAGQPFFDMADKVYASGTPIVVSEMLARSQRQPGEPLVEGIYSFAIRPVRGPEGRVDGVMVHAVEVTDQVQARQAAERAVERVSRLQATTAALSRARTPTHVARVILDLGLRATGAGAGVVVLRDEHGDALELLAAAGFPEQELGPWHRFSLSRQGPLSEAVRNKKPRWIESGAVLAHRYPQLPPCPSGSRNGSWAVLPLSAQGRTFGAIGLAFAQARGFPADEQALMLTLADQCAQALERARLYQEARERAEEQADLNTALREVAQARDRALAEADAEREQLRTIFQQVPAIVALYRGPEHVIEFANQRYLAQLGEREVLGRPVSDARPELVEQGFVALLDQVYRTGEAFVGTEAPVRDLHGEGGDGLRYFNFVYLPVRGHTGAVDAILTHAIDVTEQVLARQ